MKRIVFLLAWIALGVGTFGALALNRDLVDSYVVTWGFDPENAVWTRGVLKAVAIVLFGTPLVALLWTFASLGSDRAGTDIHGYTVLRLRAGTRFFFSFLMLGLAGGFFTGAFTLSETLVFELMMLIFGCAFLFGAYFC